MRSKAATWFECKIRYDKVDESGVSHGDDTFNNAVSSIAEVMNGSMMDYITANVQETAIIDVYEYSKVKQ